jgi:hypothetical protein
VEKVEEIGLPHEDPAAASVADAARSGARTRQGSREGEPVKAESEAVPAGSRVRLLKDGGQVGSGVIDVCMPDGSACWIWLDGGAGRRMVHESDAVEIVVFPPVPGECLDGCEWPVLV